VGGIGSGGKSGASICHSGLLCIQPAKTADQPRLRAGGLRVDFLARPCTA
jgi:hypothetical protein